MTASTQAGAPVSAARVILICALVGFLDGFDTQALSPTAKHIAASLGFPIQDLGLIFSASQIGFLLGALLLGPMGDRYGRKRMLLVTVVMFSLCSLATAVAPSYEALFVIRVLGGIGLGGATPNFVSLASEYAPPAKRDRIVTMMWAAVPLGGMAAALTAGQLMDSAGWRSVFYIGGVAPLLLVPVMARFLPESRETGKVAATRATGGTADALFAQGRWQGTMWLWLASFGGWMSLIVTIFWTPTLLAGAGHASGVATSMLALHNVGAITGTLALGALMGRLRPLTALCLALSGSALAILSMGLSIDTLATLSVATLTAGFFGSAGAGALIAVSSGLYPSAIRATGVGFALGAGRIGGFLGPLLTGLVVALAWPATTTYLAIAVPAAIAALAVLMLARWRAANPSET